MKEAKIDNKLVGVKRGKDADLPIILKTGAKHIESAKHIEDLKVGDAFFIGDLSPDASILSNYSAKEKTLLDSINEKFATK
jgi:hypothetical protein